MALNNVISMDSSRLVGLLPAQRAYQAGGVRHFSRRVHGEKFCLERVITVDNTSYRGFSCSSFH